MRRHRNWNGSITAKDGWLLLKVKNERGEWVQRSCHLRDTPENRIEAEKLLAKVRTRIIAHMDATDGQGGTLTFARWAKKWIADRRRAGVADVKNDEGRLRLYVLDHIGHMLLNGEVRPRHLIEIFNRMRADGKAPRTIRSTYSVVKAAFRDARIADVLEGSDPCILKHRQLGTVRDARPGWRRTAKYERDELVALISDPRIPEDRRVSYAIMGIGMTRPGEMAGLRFSRVLQATPLGALVIDRSYNGTTKTDTDRRMPIHPTLAAILARWKLSGWAREFGRPPTDDDLVVPVTMEHRKGRRKMVGAMRDRHYIWKRIRRDLAVLGLRHRRVYDLRRTGISLARDDGADKEILRWGTHAAPKEVIDLYTTFEWNTVCREVAKLTLREKRSTLRTAAVPEASTESSAQGPSEADPDAVAPPVAE